MEKLSKSELNAVQLLYDYDMSITDISRHKVEICSVTLHQHITEARRKLGVKTNIHLVLKAINHGLLTSEISRNLIDLDETRNVINQVGELAAIFAKVDKILKGGE